MSCRRSRTRPAGRRRPRWPRAPRATSAARCRRSRARAGRAPRSSAAIRIAGDAAHRVREQEDARPAVPRRRGRRPGGRRAGRCARPAGMAAAPSSGTYPGRSGATTVKPSAGPSRSRERVGVQRVVEVLLAGARRRAGRTPRRGGAPRRRRAPTRGCRAPRSRPAPARRRHAPAVTPRTPGPRPGRRRPARGRPGRTARGCAGRAGSRRRRPGRPRRRPRGAPRRRAGGSASSAGRPGPSGLSAKPSTGARTSTRSEPAARSALVADRMPPSMYRRPPIVIGRPDAGHRAAGRDGVEQRDARPPRRRSVNAPSAVSTAVTTSRCAGHGGSPMREAMAARRSASGTVSACRASSPTRARASCSPAAPASAAPMPPSAPSGRRRPPARRAGTGASWAA